MQKRNVISETVVSLSADIDNAGIQKLFGLLDQNRIKAYTLAAALAAATTGVYKFMQSVVKQEFELDKLAKKQSKSIEQTRAEQKALEAMGVTLNDINRDGALKKMYDDLVKFNKELEMPNMKSALENVNKLRTEFWKMKSVVSYAIQTIGAQVLTNLEMPMDRIGGKLRSAAEWVRDNLTSIGMKVGSFITAFAKGIIGIGEGVGKIFGWIQKMPDGIKGIALALGGVLLLLKTGPLGQILALVTAIGDVIHDYEVYQWNKGNRDNPAFWAANNKQGWTDNPNDADVILGADGNPMAYQVPTAFSDFWSIYTGETGETTTQGKSRAIAERLVKRITQLFTDISDVLAENHTLSDLLGGENSLIGQIFAGIGEYFDSKQGVEAVGMLFSKMFGALQQTMATAGGWGASITQSIAGIIANLFNVGDIWNDSELKKALNGDNGIINGLFGALELGAIGASPIVSIIGGALGGYKTERNNALIKLWEDANGLDFEKSGLKMSNLEEWFGQMAASGNIDPSALDSGILGGLQDDFNQTISAVLETLVGGVKLVGGAAGNIMKSLIYAIIGDNKDDAANTMKSALGEIGENNPIWDGLATGLATWIGTGNFLVGLFSGIGTTLVSAENETELEKAAQGFVNMFMTIWDGAWIDESDHSKGRNNKGLHNLITKIWEGSEEEGGLKKVFEGIGGKISEWFEPIGTAVKNWFKNLLHELTEGMPGWFKALFQIENADVSYDSGGKPVIKDGSGRVFSGEIADSISNEGLEFLSYAMPYLSIDKNGKFDRGTTYGKVSSGSRIPNIVDGNKIDGENVSLASLADYVLKYGKMPTDALGNEFSWNTIAMEYNKAWNSGNEILKPSTDKTALKVDMSVFNSALGNASGALNGVASAGEHAQSVLNNLHEPELPGEAWGGRIGSEGHYTVGEDGTEYIIPITKQDRAISLIRQMFSEMGSSAVSRVMEGFGIGTSGTFGSSPAGMASALQGMTMANTYNISAPVNINVNSNGSNAKDVGTSIYDAAERHLIKTLKGVYA